MSKNFEKPVPEPAGDSRPSTSDTTPLQTRWEMMQMLNFESINFEDSESENETEAQPVSNTINFLDGCENCLLDGRYAHLLRVMYPDMLPSNNGICAYCLGVLWMQYYMALS